MHHERNKIMRERHKLPLNNSERIQMETAAFSTETPADTYTHKNNK